MRTSLLQLLCMAAITLRLCNCDPNCINSNANQCRTSTQHTNSNTPRTENGSTAAGVSHPTENTKITTTAQISSSSSKGTAIPDSDSNTTVIVAASVATFVAVIFFVLLVLIRKRHILRNCNFPHKQPGDKKSTSFNHNMNPDIEGTSDDNKYAEMPLDNLTSKTNEDNVYQTIDPLQEQESVIDDKYSHINGDAWLLTNTSYSHIAGDFQSKRVVPDYTHIGELEGTPKADLKLKTHESDTSYDIIGKTKCGVTENPQVIEPTYNHTRSETNHTGTSTSDVNNYSHLHVLNKTTQINETMTNNRYNKNDNPNLVHKEEDLCLKEGDTEPKSIDKTEEKDTAAVVELPEASNFSLTENSEESAVDHQYFVLEKVNK